MRDKSKGTEFNEHVTNLTTIQTGLASAKARITSRQRKFFLESASAIIGSVVCSIIAIALLSSEYLVSSLQVPQAYWYLAGIILSSLAGISVLFLLARTIYQQRKRERNEAIRGVRIRESQLFKTLEHDFESIVRSREVHGK